MSSDLRKRIVLAYEEGDKTRDEVAEVFQVGRASVNRLVSRYRETGSVEPTPHGGGKPRKMTSRGEKVLRALVEDRPDAAIPEFVHLMVERAKLTLSTSTMSRELARLGLSLPRTRIKPIPRQVPRTR
ncbi:MAG TPA: helix-turn-helix domain-containing protein [Gemmatimonadaceae bacterium]|nr:helix-turn-helix domain-containing protein [Gemmatimonadaceae bacterium]